MTIGDVAKVHPAPMIRAGLVTRDGQGEIVTGLVMMLIGENSPRGRQPRQGRDAEASRRACRRASRSSRSTTGPT